MSTDKESQVFLADFETNESVAAAVFAFTTPIPLLYRNQWIDIRLSPLASKSLRFDGHS